MAMSLKAAGTSTSKGRMTRNTSCWGGGGEQRREKAASFVPCLADYFPGTIGWPLYVGEDA